VTIAVQFFASFGFFFIVLQYLQYVTGRSPLEAAVALLPLPLVLIPTARSAPRVAARFGFRRVAPVGLVVSALGFLVLSRLAIDTPYWLFALGVVLFGIGMGLAGTPATTALTSSLPMSKQGVASAMNDTARELGSAFGIAILGAILNQAYQEAMGPVVASLPPAIASRALGSIAFTASPAIADLGTAGQALVVSARDAFVSGVSSAVVAGCAVLAVAAVIVFVWSGAEAEPAMGTMAVPEPRSSAAPEIAL
jgi:predicted MFS family arabinose efflux permease